MADNKNNAQSAAEKQEQTLNQNEAFVLKYQKLFIGGVIALIVAVGAFLFFRNQSQTRHDKAATVLSVGQQLFELEMYEQALNGDSTTTFAGFAKLATELSGDDANLANLYAGLCCAKLDKWAEAEQYLEKFSGEGDQMISPAALGALGNVYAHDPAKMDKAVETLKKAAKQANNQTLSPTFLIQAGQLLESQGKKAEALAAYQDAKTYIDGMSQEQQKHNQRLNIDAYIERVAE